MNRYFFALLLGVFTLSAYAQNNRQITEFTQVPDGKSSVIWQERKNGKMLDGKYHIIENSNTYYIVEFKLGQQFGNEECYKYNRLVSRRSYKYGVKDGLSEEFATTKDNLLVVVKREKYSNNRLEGKSTQFYENGDIRHICDYSNGKRIGDEYSYYPDGTIQEEYHIYEKNGVLYRSAKEESRVSVGSYIAEFTAKLDSDHFAVYRVGEYKETWENGKLKAEAFYDDNGQKVGHWKEWSINGVLMNEQCYEHPKYSKSYYSNGTISRELVYGEDNGTVVERSYYENGKLRSEEIKRVGNITRTEYYDNGNRREEDFKNEQYQIIKEFHRNGQLRLVKEKNKGDYDFKVTECYDEKGVSVPFIQL